MIFTSNFPNAFPEEKLKLLLGKKPRGEKKTPLKMQENDDVSRFSYRCARGSHVLMCADTFDSGGTHYLRSVGLGPTLDTDPPPKTVFFVCKVMRTHAQRETCRLKFIFDGEVLDIKDNQIFREATWDEVGKEPFHVFRPHTGTELHRSKGVIFLNECGTQSDPPVIYSSNTVPSNATPLWRIPSTSNSICKSHTSICWCCCKSYTRGNSPSCSVTRERI